MERDEYFFEPRIVGDRGIVYGNRRYGDHEFIIKYWGETVYVAKGKFADEMIVSQFKASDDCNFDGNGRMRQIAKFDLK